MMAKRRSSSINKEDSVVVEEWFDYKETKLLEKIPLTRLSL
jgi:hypothetical protein